MKKEKIGMAIINDNFSEVGWFGRGRVALMPACFLRLCFLRTKDCAFSDHPRPGVQANIQKQPSLDDKKTSI